MIDGKKRKKNEIKISSKKITKVTFLPSRTISVLALAL